MLHNVLSDTFKIPVEEANRVIYDGFHGTVGARENVRKWVLERIGECERSINDYHDEILYLKKFLEILERDTCKMMSFCIFCRRYGFDGTENYRG